MKRKVGLPGLFYYLWSWAFSVSPGVWPGLSLPLWTVKGRGQLKQMQRLTGEMQAMGSRQPSAWSRLSRSAREAFKIPAELDQFTTGFTHSEQNSFWDLRWYRSGMEGGELSVRVNSDTGEDLGMYKWLPPVARAEYRGLPAYTREKAQAVAESFIQKLHPERFKETVLQQGGDYIPPLSFKERGAVEYNFNYARVIEVCSTRLTGLMLR